MKTASMFMSQHGTTGKAAQLLARILPGEDVHIFNLKEEKDPDMRTFDKVIIGSSIHAGRIQRGVKKYMREHEG